jgi:hypothetical protein
MYLVPTSWVRNVFHPGALRGRVSLQFFPCPCKVETHAPTKISVCGLHGTRWPATLPFERHHVRAGRRPGLGTRRGDDEAGAACAAAVRVGPSSVGAAACLGDRAVVHPSITCLIDASQREGASRPAPFLAVVLTCAGVQDRTPGACDADSRFVRVRGQQQLSFLHRSRVDLRGWLWAWPASARSRPRPASAGVACLGPNQSPVVSPSLSGTVLVKTTGKSPCYCQVFPAGPDRAEFAGAKCRNTDTINLRGVLRSTTFQSHAEGILIFSFISRAQPKSTSSTDLRRSTFNGTAPPFPDPKQLFRTSKQRQPSI